MAINKIVYSGTTLIDLTDTTAVESDVAQGKKFHKADGTLATGTSSGGGGGGGNASDALVFYDYDGTIVSSYNRTDALALSALPANPSHSGLTAQGWNWSLANIKSYLTKYPTATVNVGQMYITESGDTEIDVDFTDSVRLEPIMTIAVNGTVTVDWGDNTTPDTVTGTSLTTRQAVPHTYASADKYTIVIHAVSGEYTFYGTSNSAQYTLLRKNTTDNENRVYTNTIQAIRLGDGISSISGGGLAFCSSLTSITIPNGVTSIGDYAFQNCQSLTSITVPDGVTSIGAYAFSTCYSLSSITIPDGVKNVYSYTFRYCYSLSSITIPDGVTSIGSYAFQYCYSLSSITIPDDVTSIGNYAFQYCYSLSSITIPDDVTSIGASVFSYCPSLTSITIPNGATSIGGRAFQNCQSLTSITIPDSVTSIGSYAFDTCYSLSSITIPDGVTSIGSYAFRSCYSLSSITIPDGVTSIIGYAFNSCYGMKEYHLLPTAPPTLASTNAFTSIPSDCIMYVPVGSLEAYQTATNWSTYASYMREEGS